MADVESKSIPHELPSSHWLKATGQCVLERYLSATMERTNLPRRLYEAHCSDLYKPNLPIDLPSYTS